MVLINNILCTLQMKMRENKTMIRCKGCCSSTKSADYLPQNLALQWIMMGDIEHQDPTNDQVARPLILSGSHKDVLQSYPATCFGRIKLCKHSLSICDGLVSSAGANPCIYQGDVHGKCKASLGRNYHSLLLLHNFQKSPPLQRYGGH